MTWPTCIPDPLALCRAKRNFTIIAEPADGGEAGRSGLAFVIQKHWVSHLHYDLRLELDGAMKSWAVPKGPSFGPADKRMAVQFEGEIPSDQYGAGKVIICDEGVWLPLDDPLDPGHLPLMEVPTAQAVLSAAQMNVVEFHTWNAFKSSIGKPDRMTFDLDPGEGVDWKTVRQATELVHGLLSELGLVSCLKTSGGKGLHVVVPLKKQYDWDTVKSFSQAIVQHLARTVPQLFVARSGPKNRVGKIFIDYLRNGFGATMVAAWSARARPGLACRCRSAGTSWARCQGARNGPSPTFTIGSTGATRRGRITSRKASQRP